MSLLTRYKKAPVPAGGTSTSRKGTSSTPGTGAGAGKSAVAREEQSGPLVLLRPRITEKASGGAEKQTYTFDVVISATKPDVAKAVRALYGVTPRKVSMVPIVSKKKFVRGKKGKTARGKKAYVYLEKGDTIEFV